MDQKPFFQMQFRAVLLAMLICVGMPSMGQAVDYLDDEAYAENNGGSDAYDPLEPVNRVFFSFNDTVYVWFLNPVATGYSKVVPGDIRGIIGNFFYNLGEPVRSINCLLQGRFRESGLAVSRFLINSTCGVFGLGDPAATDFHIEPVYATLGETLSVWGLGDGFYLVIPLIGPSTLRDFAGTAVDSMAMSSYYPWNDDSVTMATAFGTDTINRTSLHLGLYEDIKKLSFDPYIAFRNGYFQMRSKMRDHSEFTILTVPERFY